METDTHSRVTQCVALLKEMNLMWVKLFTESNEKIELCIQLITQLCQTREVGSPSPMPRVARGIIPGEEGTTSGNDLAHSDTSDVTWTGRESLSDLCWQGRCAKEWERATNGEERADFERYMEVLRSARPRTLGMEVTG